MSTSTRLGTWGRAAFVAGTVSGRASLALGRGAGATLPGAVALRMAPSLLPTLAVGRQVTVVSGTNGKTTTTRLLVEALGSDGPPVLSNSEGSNLARGVLAALMTDRHLLRPTTVLEVDELALPVVAEQTRADLFVLGNLSRDQLDRMSEARSIVLRWQRMFAGLARDVDLGNRPVVRVVANADDPLVVAAVTGAWSGRRSSPVQVTWVAVGQPWTADAASCPACSTPWVFTPGAFRCSACGFGRPSPTWRLEDEEVHGPDGLRLGLQLGLPGRSNRANAVMATVAATLRGTTPEQALAAMGAVTAVAGRYAVVRHGTGDVRLLLAKNPAGWQEMLAQLGEAGAPQDVVLALNAQTADGEDTSWIWDVPFELLAGSRVVVSGERAEDLALRLRYAEVPFTVVRDPLDAVESARSLPGGLVQLLATYTAFNAVQHALRAAP
jgi:UDP-N-acetylmuramyl tripeptide synthase